MNNKTQSILLSGVVFGVLSLLFNFIPVLGSCFCCLSLMGAGVFHMWHLSRSQGDQFAMTGTEGAWSGSLAGVLAGIIFGTISSITFFSVMSGGPTPEMEEAMENATRFFPMSEEDIERSLELMTSPIVYVGFTFCSAIVGLVLGALGGVIGAQLFSKEMDS